MGIAAALVMGAGAWLTNWGKPPLVALGAAAFTFLLGAIGAVRERLEDRQAVHLVLGAHIRGYDKGCIPRVGAVRDLYMFGVKAPMADGSPGSGSYVERDIDRQLRRVVQESRFVLVEGESAAGKSRAAAEAVRAVWPERRLVVPASRDSLARLLDADVDLSGAVIWIDDLPAHLGEGGVNVAVLERLANIPDLAVVATQRRGEPSSAADPNPVVVEHVLGGAARVTIPPLTAEERTLALQRRLDATARFGGPESPTVLGRKDSWWRSGSLIAATLLVAASPGSSAETRPAACSPAVEVRVLTSLEKEAIVRRLAVSFEASLRGRDGCRRARLHVRSAVSAGVAIGALGEGWPSTALRDIAPEPDVWLPDSTWDLDQVRTLAGGRVELEPQGSIALSPLVLAMPPTMVQELGWSDRRFHWRDVPVLARAWSRTPRPGGNAWAFGRANPWSSSAGLAATAALYQAVLGAERLDRHSMGTPGAVGLLHEIEQLIPPGGDDTATLLCSLRRARGADSDGMALLISEKAVTDYNLGRPLGRACTARSGEARLPLIPVYAQDGAPFLDHPFVLVRRQELPRNEPRRRVAREFFAFLQGATAQDGLRDEGFRRVNGAGETSDGESVRQQLRTLLPENVDADALLATWTDVRTPARLLFAVDVSAVMAEPFRDVDGTRVRAADHAISRSLRLMGDEDQVGLWEFGGEGQGRPGHRHLVALGRPHETIAGSYRVDVMRQHLNNLKPAGPDSTPLYDTISAAISELRWLDRTDGVRADAKSNAVVVLTEQAGNDRSRTSASALAEAIRVGASQSVRVFVITFGTRGCSSFALDEITRESGGQCYEVSSMLDIGQALDGVAVGLWGGGR